MVRTTLGKVGCTTGPVGCFPARLAHSRPGDSASSPHLVETPGSGFCMALFLVVETARDSGDWVGEERGREGKEREKRKRQGAWLVRSQCVREGHGSRKPAMVRCCWGGKWRRGEQDTEQDS